MKNRFQKVLVRQPKKNLFDLSHERKMTMNMGILTPCYLEEIVPGDRFSGSSEVYMKFAPLLAPIMHRVDVYMHTFFVPNRIVWDGWESFITGGVENTSAENLPLLPIGPTNRSDFFKGTLADYLGVPITPDQTINQFAVNALPFRAYQKIYNDWFRNQNLIPEVQFKKTSVVDSAEAAVITKLQKRSWEKDYFTSALPFAQAGGAVELPSNIKYSNPSKATDSTGANVSGDITSNASGQILGGAGNNVLTTIENIESLGVTINDLRQSARLQEWLEKNARAGSRYVEQILSHFGVRSSDARLQRAEYLGGGKLPVSVTEVLSTYNSQSDATEPVPGGQMYGHATGMGKIAPFDKTFEEHGFIMSLISVLPRTAYQQHLERFWVKTDKFDYFWPEFANIGEQEVKKMEVYTDYLAGGNDLTFGYQERYGEYKFKQSSVHGDFVDDLSYWHLGRNFSSKPELNKEFVECTPDHDIFAVTDPDVHKLYVQIYNKIRAIRPMPKFGIPTL